MFIKRFLNYYNSKKTNKKAIKGNIATKYGTIVKIK